MPLEKHEQTQKQKDDRLKFWKEYIDHDFSQTVFIDGTLFRVEKSKQRKWRKIGKSMEFHIISMKKKVNTWVGISKDGKTSIQLFTENMTKKLYVSIMEKHLKEMERMIVKSFELIWDNDPKHTSNLAKEFYKKHCKRID